MGVRSSMPGGLNKENEERPKRKKTELLNDIFESCSSNRDEDSYAEDFAEMEVRFRKKASLRYT